MNILISIILVLVAIYTALAIINEGLRVKQNWTLRDRVKTIETSLLLTMKSESVTRRELEKLKREWDDHRSQQERTKE